MSCRRYRSQVGPRKNIISKRSKTKHPIYRTEPDPNETRSITFADAHTFGLRAVVSRTVFSTIYKQISFGRFLPTPATTAVRRHCHTGFPVENTTFPLTVVFGHPSFLFPHSSRRQPSSRARLRGNNVKQQQVLVFKIYLFISLQIITYFLTRMVNDRLIGREQTDVFPRKRNVLCGSIGGGTGFLPGGRGEGSVNNKKKNNPYFREYCCG